MTFLASVDISTYEGRSILAKASAEDFAEFRRRYPSLNVPEKQEELKDWWEDKTLIVDEDDIDFLRRFDFTLKLRKVKGLIHPPEHTAKVLTQISVANVGLFEIRRVQVLEDSCTDQVQTMLDEGWRIVAVCPPNDTRRPTYIMGHVDHRKNR